MNANGLIRKQLGRKTRRRRYRRRPALMRMQRRPSAFWGGKISPFQCEVAVPVYIYGSSTTTYLYSFSSGSDQTRFTIWSLNSVMYATDIMNQFNSFMYYRIKGVKLSFTRSINAALNTVYQLPACYFDILPETNGQANTFISNPRWVSESDTAFEILPLNTSSVPQTKYYSFGSSTFFNNSFHISFGKGGWISTAMQPTIQLALGYLDFPQLSNTTDAPKIGSVTATFYLDFCKRGRITNY